MGEQLFALTRY